MKIIDLLNRIANGEAVPKKIHIKPFQCDFIFNGNTYLSEEQQNIYWCLHSGALNYEVEILGEEKKIPEKLTIKYLANSKQSIQDDIIDKINAIIDYLESKEKGE